MNNKADSSASEKWATIYKSDVVNKLFNEFWPRIYQCIDECDQELLWYQPNKNCNSIGNLVLHLEGNVRQWIISGIGGKPDVRTRKEEFIPNQPLTAKTLQKKLEDLKDELIPLMDQLTEDDLLKNYHIQTFSLSGIGVLLQVTEHFSYHLGQITYLVKQYKNIDTGYYADLNLD